MELITYALRIYLNRICRSFIEQQRPWACRELKRRHGAGWLDTAPIPVLRTVEIKGGHHNIMNMEKSLIYVDDSPIHGKGLFARKYIGAGELIGTLDGAPTSTDGEYVLWLDEGNGFHVR